MTTTQDSIAFEASTQKVVHLPMPYRRLSSRSTAKLRRTIRLLDDTRKLAVVVGL
jgi:hypothetical protein